MRRILTVCVVTGMMVGFGVTAFAQDAPRAGEASGGTGGSDVVYEKETAYDFEADDVEGALVKPDGEDIGGEGHGKTSSLIKIRADFIPEMLESVEEI